MPIKHQNHTNTKISLMNIVSHKSYILKFCYFPTYTGILCATVKRKKYICKNINHITINL